MIRTIITHAICALIGFCAYPYLQNGEGFTFTHILAGMCVVQTILIWNMRNGSASGGGRSGPPTEDQVARIYMEMKRNGDLPR